MYLKNQIHPLAWEEGVDLFLCLFFTNTQRNAILHTQYSQLGAFVNIPYVEHHEC